MSRFEETITVDVPVRTAYDRWTQFEEFPSFMEGVKDVEQVDDKHLRWTAEVAGVEKQWDAEITDQTPDTRVAWKSTSGTDNAGAVLFAPKGPTTTEITLRIEAEPEGLVETAGDALGFLQRRVHGDLERFKDQVEEHGATEGWRGEIHGDEIRPDYESYGAAGPIAGAAGTVTTQPGSAPDRGTPGATPGEPGGGVREGDERTAANATERAPIRDESEAPPERREAGQDR